MCCEINTKLIKALYGEVQRFLMSEQVILTAARHAVEGKGNASRCTCT